MSRSGFSLNKLFCLATGCLTILVFPDVVRAVTFAGTQVGDFGIVDTGTGNFTSIGNTPEFFDIAYNGGRFGFGINVRNELFAIDVRNGATNLVGSAGTDLGINALGFDNSGTLFGAAQDILFTIDTGSGKASVNQVINGYESSGDLAFDNSTGVFFGTSLSPNSDTLFAINPNNAEDTAPIGNGLGFSNVFGLAFDGSLFGYTRGGTQFQIDTSTGVGLNPISVTGQSMRQGGNIIGAAPIPVPEPTTTFGSLLLSAFSAAFLLRKNRKGRNKRAI